MRSLQLRPLTLSLKTNPMSLTTSPLHPPTVIMSCLRMRRLQLANQVSISPLYYTTSTWSSIRLARTEHQSNATPRRQHHTHFFANCSPAGRYAERLARMNGSLRSALAWSSGSMANDMKIALKRPSVTVKNFLLDTARCPYICDRKSQGQGGLRLHLTQIPCDRP